MTSTAGEMDRIPLSSSLRCIHHGDTAVGSMPVTGRRPSGFGRASKARGQGASVFVGGARMRAYQTSLRKTSSIVESSAFSLKGLISTVAFTRLKKNSMAGLFG